MLVLQRSLLVLRAWQNPDRASAAEADLGDRPASFTAKRTALLKRLVRRRPSRNWSL